MSSIAVCTRASIHARLQYFFWSRPEWWSLALCYTAWAFMLAHGWQHGADCLYHPLPFTSELANWILMIAAMMLPFTIGPIRAAAGGSLWARRHRAVAGFLTGYFMPWVGFGMAAVLVRQHLGSYSYAAAALAFALAAWWQRTGIHNRALMACHRSLPLAPVGWQAHRDCVHYGVLIGTACIRSCWPLMLACLFAGHSLLAMTAGLGLGVLERWSFRPHKRAMLACTLAVSSYCAVQAIIPVDLLASPRNLINPLRSTFSVPIMSIYE